MQTELINQITKTLSSQKLNNYSILVDHDKFQFKANVTPQALMWGGVVDDAMEIAYEVDERQFVWYINVSNILEITDKICSIVSKIRTNGNT